MERLFYDGTIYKSDRLYTIITTKTGMTMTRIRNFLHSFNNKKKCLAIHIHEVSIAFRDLTQINLVAILLSRRRTATTYERTSLKQACVYKWTCKTRRFTQTLVFSFPIRRFLSL